MNKQEFDEYAKNYDEVLNNTIPEGLNDNLYFAEYKVALMAKFLKSGRISRILDFGCGAGRSIQFLKSYFPESEVWGYDVSPASIDLARSNSPDVNFFSDWSALAKSVEFDAIIAANVFHHIPLAQRPDALSNCRARLSSSGQMFMFEHNPYNPMTRWIFERCPFDANAEMLTMANAIKLCSQAGFRTEQHGYTLFFPKPLSFLRRIEPFLKHVPLGAQYYVQMAK